MKKIGILFGLLLMSIVCLGQEYQRIEEIEVVAPTYKTNVTTTKTGATPLADYLTTELTKQAYDLEFRSGKVIVDFMVNKDGTLSDFTIKNHVSRTNDNAVIDVLKSTSGSWLPGKNNGEAIAMEKRIVINFNDENGISLVKQAQDHYFAGLRKFYKANEIANSNFISQEKKDKKVKRKLNYALSCFEEASKFRPNEHCVLHYEAHTYDMLGNTVMRDLKFLEINELVKLHTENHGEAIAFNFK